MTSKPTKAALKITLPTAATAGPGRERHASAPNPFAPASPPPGVAPDAVVMAQDDAVTVYEWALSSPYGGYDGGLTFLGYPYLATLAQRPEYRRMSEIIAKDMTRRWVTLSAAGEDDKSERVAQLTAAMERFDVRAHFQRVAELDSFFGRAHLYVDTGKTDDAAELEAPLFVDKRKIKVGSLLAFRPVEPVWTYPDNYNSADPLKAHYYRPKSWFVMGKKVHASRLLTFVSREVPDLLKPAYSFGGVSLSQMALPYVDNWIRTRQSVSDLLHSYSKDVLKTNMAAVLQGGGADDLIARAELYNRMRDNRGVSLLDMDTEDFVNVSTPLSTLDALQAQSQEQMASVAGIPLVVLLGITPSGLNASSDGEIKTYYAWIASQQQHLFATHLKTVLDILQLNEFGDIDEDVTFTFNSLWEDDDATVATIRKTNADRDMVYVDGGVLSPEEIRNQLAADENGPYHAIDLSAPPPEPPADPGLEGDPALEGEEPPAQDAAGEWEESKHPRAANGQFGSGGGGASGGKAKAPPKSPEPASAAPGGGSKMDFSPAAREKLLAAGHRYIPPSQFNAAEYAKLHDKFDVSESDILNGFPIDTAARLKSVQARVDESKPTVDQHRDAQGNWTPERRALHQKIITDLLSEEAVARARPEAGQAPTFTVLGGRGGSGKSKLSGVVYDPSKAIVLDPDHIKAQLPEYEGWNAAQVHEESGEISDEITRLAKAAGLNLVHDATLKSPEKAKALVEGFKDSGYRVEAHYMHLPRQEAAKRAVERFTRAGRYVPPAVVLQNTRNEESFEGIKGLVDAWSFRDNNVPPGEPPALISQSDK
jgi:phage-related protein (TIGR01555 family)